MQQKDIDYYLEKSKIIFLIMVIILIITLFLRYILEVILKW